MTFLLAIGLGLLALISPCAGSEWIEAARKDKVDTIQRLASSGHDINEVAQDGTGQTALMAAILIGNTKVVEALIALGADLTIPEKDGYTAMHAACFQGRQDEVRLLLKAGVKADEFHSDGFPPIFRAAWGKREGHVEAMRILVEEGGVDVNQRSAGGVTLMKHVLQTPGPAADKMFEFLCWKGYTGESTGHLKDKCANIRAKGEKAARREARARPPPAGKEGAGEL